MTLQLLNKEYPRISHLCNAFFTYFPFNHNLHLRLSQYHFFMKKRLYFLVLLFFAANNLSAQNCFYITNILADACGSPEGENEMVRFKVGAAPLVINTMNVTWPNGNFLGICQNAITAQKVTDLNATIQSCGYLIEPTGGVLPANSNVLLVTSTNMNVAFNSFANLTDTMYVIFQCAGNTQGHFRNYSSTITTPRILTINFGAVCSNTVQYYPNQLINQFGQLDTAAQDGSSIAYDSLGNSTYYNNGCQAPIITLTATLTASATTTCAGSTITLTAYNLTGINTGFFWSGGNGTIVNTNALSTNYQTSATFTGIDLIFFSMLGQCNDTISYFIPINIQNGLPVNITGPSTVCANDTIILTASNGATYLWSNGQTTPSIAVTQPGTYSVTATGTCGITTASVTISGGSAPIISVSPGTNINICQGQSTTLTASGSTAYFWSTGANTPSINVNAAGIYTVYSSNACGTDSVQVIVTQNNTASVTISATGSVLCGNDTIFMTASGASSYLWSNGATTATTYAHFPGIYTVTGTSACGTASASFTVSTGTAPSISVSPGTAVSICTGQSATLTASGATSYFWSTGSTNASISVSNGGIYTVYSTNTCGTDSIQVTVTETNQPSVTISTPTTTLCPGSTTTLTASGASSYSWSSGQTTPSITVNAAGTYTVTGTSTCGTSIASQSITTGALPVAQITSSGTILCPGGTLSLNASGGNAYSWSNGSTGNQLNVSQAGQYFVYVSNTCGVDTASIILSLSQINAAFTSSVLGGTAPLPVTFYNNSVFYSGSSWNFGDGSTSSSDNPIHTFAYGGAFNVILTIEDSNGCIDTASALIDVKDDSLRIPNVITPNNDGKNDVFSFSSTIIKSTEITIYNRWGNKITSYTDWKKGWDAHHADAGVYFYTIELTQQNGEVKKIHGSLNVIK